MPKPLRTPQPTSSVARLLDLDSAARAVARRQPTIESGEPSTSNVRQFPVECAGIATGETPNIKRELVLTRSADETLTRLVEHYRRVTRTRLTTSHVVRAMLKSVAHRFEQLESEGNTIGLLKLPSNARGKELERERFEARIADAFASGMHSSSAVGEPPN